MVVIIGTMMLRAAVHGDVRIMVPMITTTRELREVRALLARAARELVERDVPHGQDVPLGMMVEVPSAAVLADVFARHVDFFSIGTNDLLQYSLAIDRTSRSLASLASPFDPSILRLVHNVARVGLERPIPVALCGAMASDPLAAALLVGLGLRELSMEAAAIPEIKEALRRISLQEAEEAARECLAQEAAEAVEACLASRFALRFFDLLAGGPEEALSRNER